MPTYEYLCEKCGHRFEKFQSMSDKPLSVCPVCHGSVSRLLGTGAGLIFKGAGFYATDYRSSSYNKEAKAEKEGGNISSGQSSSSSDQNKGNQGDKK